MKKPILLPFLLTLLLLSTSLPANAWVTAKNFKLQMDTWVGHFADDLVNKWGSPQSTYTRKDGGRVLTYTTNSGTTGGITPVGTTYMVFNRQWYCRVNFSVDSEDVITEVNWEGNNCKANKPK